LSLPIETTFKMSTLVDMIASDNLPSSSIPPPTDPRSENRASSRGAPSESNAHSDHEGMQDDEIVGARGASRRPRGGNFDIPRVVDEIGEHMVQQFEDFLET
jgi:DNA replication licensing factor MCM6